MAEKKLKYATGFKACYEDWDFKKQRVKSNKSLLINAREVNNLLNLFETLNLQRIFKINF